MVRCGIGVYSGIGATIAMIMQDFPWQNAILYLEGSTQSSTKKWSRRSCGADISTCGVQIPWWKTDLGLEGSQTLSFFDVRGYPCHPCSHCSHIPMKSAIVFPRDSHDIPSFPQWFMANRCWLPRIHPSLSSCPCCFMLGVIPLNHIVTIRKPQSHVFPQHEILRLHFPTIFRIFPPASCNLLSCVSTQRSSSTQLATPLTKPSTSRAWRPSTWRGQKWCKRTREKLEVYKKNVNLACFMFFSMKNGKFTAKNEELNHGNMGVLTSKDKSSSGKPARHKGFHQTQCVSSAFHLRANQNRRWIQKIDI